MKKSEDQHQRILAVARSKFLRFGFNRMSIDSIVRELRTSKSTVYKYYQTKNDLIKAVIDQLNNEINTRLEDIINDEDLSFCGKLNTVVEFTKNTLTEINEEFLQDLKLYTPEIWDYYEKGREYRIDTYYRKLFNDGVIEGAVRKDIDLEILMKVYFNLTEMTVDADQFSKVSYTNQELYAEISKVFLEGALVRDKEKHESNKN
jgi:AcrR family transcriptional regulator